MYQALYRKWRPKTFDEVVGQGHITETLKNQIITGRLSHAYLFIGTRGTGKTTCAKILAKALNCQHPVNGNPCGVCPACRGIEDGSILDIVEIDAASNNSVADVRQLQDEAVFSPVSVKKRVYIIDEVHMLSTAAFNALLKILEEPPAHLVFILATTELNKVPATILSRCQRHSFKRLDSDVISSHLEHIASCEGLKLTPDAAALIAGLAEGGMRDALSLLDQCSGSEIIDVDTVYSAMGLTGNRRTAKLFEYTVKRDTDSALKLFNELWSDGKDPATLLGELNTLLRDCLMASVAPRSCAGLLSGRFGPEIISVFIKKLNRAELINRINTVTDYQEKIRFAKSPKLSAELCIISLCDPVLTEGLDELRARISRLEEDLRNAPVRVCTMQDSADIAVQDEEIPFAADDFAEEESPFAEEAIRDEEPPFDEDVEPAEEAEACEEGREETEPEEDPLALNPDAPEEANAAPTDAAELWAAIIEKAEGNLAPGLIPIITDPENIRCEIDYSTMQLYVRKGFWYNQINDQNVIICLRSAAQEVTGRSLRVSVSEMAENTAPTRSIEELRKYKETRFL